VLFDLEAGFPKELAEATRERDHVVVGLIGVKQLIHRLAIRCFEVEKGHWLITPLNLEGGEALYYRTLEKSTQRSMIYSGVAVVNRLIHSFKTRKLLLRGVSKFADFKLRTII